MIFFLIIFLISCGVLFVLLMRDLPRLRTLTKEEFFFRYNSAKPFWQDFHDLFVVPTIRLHQEKVRPAAYKEIEKLARRFRIIILRIECLLLRFSEYVRGKRVMSSNGHKSHYWEQLNNCKNGANHKKEE
ncbi:MAG: hypothetical protein V1877_00410 [Candidatus Tagabacteria bacterium]